MLLTLMTRSLARRLSDTSDPDGLTMFEVPGFAMRQLQLRGLNVPASLLAGWNLADLDRLRDAADKAGCPCLVLVEDQPLVFADPDPAVRQATAERLGRLAAGAHRLGCNALGVAFEAPNTDDAFEQIATEVKAVLPDIERLELNLLIAPHEGLTDDPDRLTDLIKRIGGFRIGSLPSFAHAAKTGDAVATLRKLAPYAGAVHASVDGFTKSGAHKGCDLAECVAAIKSVGFVNTLAIDYSGNGDASEAIEQARDVLQAAIDAET